MRTLLVALVAAVSYFVEEPPIANAADPTQEEAILALRRAGVDVGTTESGFFVKISPESDDAPAELFKNLRFLKDLKDVEVVSTKVDERLALIADLPGIQHLSIYMYISDKGLKHLSKHTELTTLTIAFSNKVTDAGLVHLQTLKNLEKLKLTETKVTKQGINKLYKFLPKCLAELN